MTEPLPGTDASPAPPPRDGATLWAKGRSKIKSVMVMNGMWGKERKRSIFGNQFGKGDLLQDMPEIHIERVADTSVFDSAEGDTTETARTDVSDVVGWNGTEETAHTEGGKATEETTALTGKGYKTDVRATISKLKRAAKKVKRFLNVVRMAHDPTCRNVPLSYNQVLAKLREHYDPDGIHSDKHADQHEYYTDLGLLKRESLKHHPQIRVLLDQLWQAADKNGDGGLDKGEYLTMCRKVYKAIVDDSDEDEDKEERDRIAEEDWEADSQGHLTLDYRRFTTAWFQLADHWTHDLNIAAYCRFLGKIKDTVTHYMNGKIVWKDDSNIGHMEMEEQETNEPEPDTPKEVAPPEEEIVVKIVQKKSVPKPIKKKTIAAAPKLTKIKEKRVQAVMSGMVLQEGNPNDKSRNLARMASRNGLYRGSTVPPPRGWSATKTNQWGITFTRIKMESQAKEQKEAAQSLGVRASLSSPSRHHQHRPSSSQINDMGRTSDLVGGSSSFFNDGSAILGSIPVQQQPQQYVPSSSGGFQSSQFRYPKAYDATVGAIGGGFEWNNPVEGVPGKSRLGENTGSSELLRPSWVNDSKQEQRPATAHAYHGTHDKGGAFQSSWVDQLARPSTSSAYLPPQATLTLVPVDSFSNMLDYSDCATGVSGGGSSILLKSTESMGSMMLEYLQDNHSPGGVQQQRRKKKKKVKRPKTAPGKPREHQFDRKARGILKSTKQRRQHHHQHHHQRQRQQHQRSTSPPRQRNRSQSPPKSAPRHRESGRVTRMRKRAGPSNVLSPAGIPQPVGTLEPLFVRPMTTGGIRRKRSGRKIVKIESGSLFRTSIVRPTSPSQVLPQEEQQPLPPDGATICSSSSVLSFSAEKGGTSTSTSMGGEEFESIGGIGGGSRVLDPTEMRGLPTSARNLMNQYAGYDPLASLTEASLSIGGSSILSSFASPSSSSNSRRGRGRRKRKGSGRGKKHKNGPHVDITGGNSYQGTTGGEASSMSISAYMSTLVMPASQRTIKLLKLREDCTTEDIVGVMLAVGACIAPKDVTLSDVSSKTRLRRASVRFGKYKDYKLALKMLEICNRAEHVRKKQASCSRGGKGERPEVTRALWGSAGGKNGAHEENDGEYSDDFGLVRLSPLQKVNMPSVLRT